MKTIAGTTGKPLLSAVTLLNLLIALAFVSASSTCGANGATSRSADQSIETQIQRFIEEQTSQILGRIEVDVGQLDPRLNLAPCGRTEAYLTAGTRLWGKSKVGLRCVSGAFWSVSIPVQVRVFGSALVTTRSIEAGQRIQHDDLREQELELTNEPGRPVQDLASIENKILSRSIASGVIVREDWLRAMPVVQSGDQVRVHATGTGFSITSEGFALNSATAGQQVKVRVESGRVVTGIARPGRIAEIRL
ncbi:MAG: flagellar basal body P-ring formation protein FlgA [Rhodocyclaceae bacterium]|nr:flagellar basal body P-ring formation protein FlgA [Rhodocyclaceae bacterium]MCA3026712.1 flagellar basal body P-ring formation protein FlgA [Rhodocyclaceae bacterium]MCA3031146.1 flagellar basal body P-ring formation protein FlgA [Rhodocyclaceae bacterium]MCA3036462.1 flagellar basal body P-ring formation protein FlgA [Rhodocyclaceae bacterium]MCA3040268.1 flagellar basal body P-ring formation protein FlgA [Rhodocyclaceae bacterium]